VKLAPDDEMIDVVVNDGILRMFIEEPKPAAGKHRRCLSLHLQTGTQAIVGQ